MNRLRISIIIALAMLMPTVALANGHYGYNYATVTPTTVAPGDYITVEFSYNVNVSDGSSTSLWAVFFDAGNGQVPYDSAGIKLAEGTPTTGNGYHTFPVSVVVQIPEDAEAGQHSINIFSCAASYNTYNHYAWYGDPPIMITVEDPVIDVEIDIKPGSTPNTINLGSNGVIPVAILSSADFDAPVLVDTTTVQLQGKAGVRVKGNGDPLATERDVNGDGYIDLELKIEVENLEPGDIQDGIAEITGQTIDGQEFSGTDQVTIVPPE